MHLAGIVAHGNPHAVTVGIGADDNLGSLFVGEVDAHGKSWAILRVGGGNGRKASVLNVLLGNSEHFKAKLIEQWHNAVAASAMEVGKDHLGFILAPLHQVGT